MTEPPYPPSPYGAMPAEPPSYAAGASTPEASPPNVALAAWLMFVNAAISLISVLTVLALRSTLREEIRKANPDFDAAKLDTTVNFAVAAAVVIGLIVVVLYVLLALQVRNGKNWARIVTWVVAGLGVISMLSSFGQTAPLLSHVLSIIVGLIDIAIIILLIMANGTGYFRSRRPGY